MRKVFLRLSKRINEYWTFAEARSMNFDLKCLWESFDCYSDWINIDKQEDGFVEIWSDWEFKDKDPEKKRPAFYPDREYEKSYSAYVSKRYEDIPILKITERNYDELLKDWQEFNKSKKFEYIVIEEDDYVWVRLKPQHSLSQDDQEYIQQDLKAYDNFVEKLKVYRAIHRQNVRIWSDEKDNEFYSDFLTEEEMVWKKKKF